MHSHSEILFYVTDLFSKARQECVRNSKLLELHTLKYATQKIQRTAFFLTPYWQTEAVETYSVA